MRTVHSSFAVPLAALLGLLSFGCMLHGGPLITVGGGAAWSDGPGAPPPSARPVGDEVDDGDDDDEVPPPEALPPAKDPDRSTVERQLAPYGRWVETPEYGRVWVPADQDDDWQPYVQGRWVWTLYGWSFVAGVPWGLTFHYGRWGWGAEWGWYWVPGFVWAPAWVAWRWSAGWVCWSALGPRGHRYGRHWRGWVAVPSHAFRGPVIANRVPHAGPIVRGTRPGPSIGSGPARGAGHGPPRAVGSRGSAHNGSRQQSPRAHGRK